MGSRYTRPELPEIVIGFSTSDATPYTPAALQVGLAPGSLVRIQVSGSARAADGTAAVFEFSARNAWIRTSGGVSSRVGTTAGQQTSVGNTFPAPSSTRPTLTFTEPSATHRAWPVFTGRAGVLINWSLTARVEEDVL